jgi:hypothetical protein
MNYVVFILIALNALNAIEIPGNSHLTPDIRSKWGFRVPKLGNGRTDIFHDNAVGPLKFLVSWILIGT